MWHLSKHWPKHPRLSVRYYTHILVHTYVNMSFLSRYILYKCGLKNNPPNRVVYIVNKQGKFIIAKHKILTEVVMKISFLFPSFVKDLESKLMLPPLQ